MELTKSLKTLIKIVNYPFKPEQELELLLKKRLTKKEFKLLKELSRNRPKEQIRVNLNFEQNEFKRVEANLIKKLNQEQTKQLLYKFNKFQEA